MFDLLPSQFSVVLVVEFRPMSCFCYIKLCHNHYVVVVFIFPNAHLQLGPAANNEQSKQPTNIWSEMDLNENHFQSFHA